MTEHQHSKWRRSFIYKWRPDHLKWSGGVMKFTI